MSVFTIYEAATGDILRVVGTSREEPNLNPGEAYVEGNFPDNAFKMIDGQPVSIPAPTEPEQPLTDIVRAQRNAQLSMSDWTQLPDANVDTLAWQAYRQALRDVPQQPGFPDNVEWPVPPA